MPAAVSMISASSREASALNACTRPSARRRRGGEVRGARGGGHDLEALRRLDEDLIERALAGQHVRQRVARREAEQHVDVREAEIAIEQHHAPAVAAEAVARLTETLVLPTPPLPPVTAMTCTGPLAARLRPLIELIP